MASLWFDIKYFFKTPSKGRTICFIASGAVAATLVVVIIVAAASGGSDSNIKKFNKIYNRA
ncbi:MAG: hypothetical protein MJ252_19770 [archaeon]|nr:hypothetical protein [archaeon]